MRVLLVAAAFPPTRCGIGDYSAHLAQTLAARGNWVPTVLTTTRRAESREFEIIHCNPAIVGYRDVIDAIRLVRPDVVHIQYPSQKPISSLVPIVARRLFGLPVVQTWHEHYRECIQLNWLNLLGLDALAYVRDDLPQALPRHVAFMLRGKVIVHIPNTSSIRPVILSESEREYIHKRIAGDRPIVAFFGFAHPNKGVHSLFDVADPDRHHVILISDLDRQNDYQRSVLERIEGSTWRRHVSVTGFLPAPEVAKLLAVSDAVVFPFPRGIGAWNTSVLAAMESGVFVLGTALDSAKVGYDAQQNLLLTLCGDVVGMREGLDKYLGRRRAVSNTGNSWASLATVHEVLYAGLV